MVKGRLIWGLVNDRLIKYDFHQVSEYGGGARVVWAMSAGDREAEAQAKKGDEAASNDRDSRAAAALKQYWCVGLRALELVSYVDNNW